MNINLLQAKQLIDDHLGTSIVHRNNEYSYQCPFCNHYKKKLQVNLITQAYHCWVCGQKGRSLSYLFKKTKASTGVYQKIKDIYGDSSYSSKSTNESYNVELPPHFKPLYITQNTPDYKNAFHYITKVRKLTIFDVLRYNIGYCDQGPYAGMIIVPSYDATNNINYFVGRSYYDTATVKHKKPPISIDFVGFENQINWNEPVIIVEGAFDAITTKRNAIPLFGKIITNGLKAKISAKTKDLYIALDKDALKTAIGYIEYFLNQNINVYLVDMHSKDPSEAGYETMLEYIHKARKIDFFELLKLKMLTF